MKFDASQGIAAAVFGAGVFIGGFLHVDVAKVQAVATLLVGAAASAIAYRQWRTAHEKIVLDVLPYRVAMLEKLGYLTHSVMNHEEFDELEAHRIHSHCTFYFNDTVTASIRQQIDLLFEYLTKSDRSGLVAEIDLLNEPVKSDLRRHMRMEAQL
jgi:hypothetical protein